MKSEAKRETSFLLLVELARHPFPPFLHRIANVIITYGTRNNYVELVGEGASIALNTLLIGRGKVAVRGIFVAVSR